MSDQKEKKGTKPEKYSPEQIIAALEVSAGILSAAAVKLGCAPTTVTNYINRYPEIQESLEQILEDRLDLAETAILKAIKDGDVRASTFYLDRKGRNRGYGHKTQLSGEGGGPIKTSVDLSGYTTDELRKLQSIARAAKKRAANGAAEPNSH